MWRARDPAPHYTYTTESVSMIVDRCLSRARLVLCTDYNHTLLASLRSVSVWPDQTMATITVPPASTCP